MTKPGKGVKITGLVIFFCLGLYLLPAPAQAKDKTPPQGSISINNGASYTSSTSVTLYPRASDKGSGMKKGKMRFMNSGSSWSSPESYKSSKSWSLSSGEGTKTVYVRYADSEGNWSGSSSIYDTIILDTSSPSTPTVTDDGSSVSSTASLHCKWSSSDSVSGIAEYQYQITKGSSSGTVILSWTSGGTSTETTKSSLSLENGQTYYFQVKAKNNAGLWSSIGYSDGITVKSGSSGEGDTTAPNITQVSPEDKSFVYKGESPTLKITTDDSDFSQNYYQFSIDGTVKQSWTTNSSYSWDTASVSLKKYTLKFEAKDDGGSSSKEINVLVINKPVSPPEGY